MAEADYQIKSLLIRLWNKLSKRRKWQLLLFLGLMLISGLAEMMSLGAVLPFLGILLNPEKAFHYPAVSIVARILRVSSAEQMILPITVIFIIAVIMAGIIRLLVLWTNIRFSNGCSAEFSFDLYRRTLYQPYSAHLSRNTSVIISGITKVQLIQGVLQALLTVVAALVLIVSIVSTLLAINALVAIVATVGFGAAYMLITRMSRWRLRRNSQCVAREETQMIKALQEGLGGIRDILLDGTQGLYCNIFRDSQIPLLRSNGSTQFIAQSPRYLIEALGMVLIACLAYGLSRKPDGMISAMPVLGALALGAQRILPAIQQLYSGLANISGRRASLADALELLEQPLPKQMGLPEPEPLCFKRSIYFDKVRFRYSKSGQWVLDGLDASIPKGARVGFVGSTGSGKSTALDLLMGLLEPVEGQILVDDHPIQGEYRRTWQKAIAHVPQNIYLADSSLAENIAFGIPVEKIDMERVRIAARQAHIADFIEDMPEGYQSMVGERGVRLSGGQRQRIGIARALYKRSVVLIFDEATSALDNATERAIVDSIEGLASDLTVVLVAHRLSTVRRCDIIFEMDKGKVVAQGTYEQLIKSSSSFRNMAQMDG